MTKCPVRMLLLYSASDGKYALLYADGTMTKFAEDKINSQALADLLTRYQSANILTSDGKDVARWKAEGADDRLDEQSGFGYTVAAQVIACDANDDAAGFRLEIIRSEVIGLWLAENETVTVDEIIDPIESNSNYLSLEEYCNEVNATRAEDEKITLNAVRSKVARHALPGCVKIGSRWAVPSGTPWPKDKRIKHAE